MPQTMNRRHLAFIVLLNALISFAIALAVVWAIEQRRPDPEELAALGPALTPASTSSLAVLAPTPGSLDVLPTVGITTGVTETAAGGEAVATPGAEQAAAPSEPVIYVVEAGDSLLSIATRYGVTVEDIVRANDLANPDFVFSGQRLAIPVPNGEASAEAAPQPAAPADSGAGLQISAVENPGDLAAEAVLLVNESDTPVNLQGWRLERSEGPSYTFGNVPLFAGSSVRVYSGSGQDSTQALYWNQTAPVWSSGATAQLVNSSGAVVKTSVVQ